MGKPLINILIRVSRPTLYKRCYASILSQTYKNWRIRTFRCPGNCKGYDYNLYCNILKDQVKEGWFFFLDDDDILADDMALERIARHLINEDVAVICQMLRNGKPKPSNTIMDRASVEKGRIGMPCIFLHSKHKNIADFNNKVDADFWFIYNVGLKLGYAFAKEIVVNAGSRSYGKQETNDNTIQLP